MVVTPYSSENCQNYQFPSRHLRAQVDLTGVFTSGSEKKFTSGERLVISIKRYKPDQIVALPRQIDIERLTT